ncbi:MAG TPA: DUF3813 family protein [Virgibacillus sp.]|nr:DUF3813 family protein [Virgibacillus sp.]
MSDRYLFQQAKDAVNRLTTKQKSPLNNQDKQAAQQAIQIAYQACSPEERELLQQLEAELNQENTLQS